MTNLSTTPVESTLTASSANDYTQMHDDTVQPVSPKRSPTKKSRKSSSAQKRKRKTVVFATKSKYHWFVLFCMLTPFLTILLRVILFDAQDDYKNSSTIWAMGWISVFLVVLYMAVIPRKVDVRSNGTVAVKTCLLTFFIDDIAGAYRGSNNAEYIRHILRPHFLLITSVDRNDIVVIRRKHEKWDVTVSPEDVDGFLEALEGMLLKEESDGSFVVVGKPSRSEPV